MNRSAVWQDAVLEDSQGIWENISVSALADTQDIVISAVATLTEALPYFELAGYRLERENHGAPQCPDIRLNEKKASGTQPQAWSKDISGQKCWFYNYLGALAESDYLGKVAPTTNEWIDIFASIEGKNEEKAETLNIPFAGSRDPDSSGFFFAGHFADIWSSSPDSDEGNAHYIILKRGEKNISRGWTNRERGMSLRFLSDKK